MRRKKTNKPKINRVKIIIDGTEVASKLESYMWKCLKNLNIKFRYEPKSFSLIDSFNYDLVSYEKQSNGKGDFINRGNKKVRGITYKPDFTNHDIDNLEWVIECKGWGNESFPMRWKLFKKMILNENKNVTLFKPQTRKDCEKTALLILELQNKNNGNKR